MNVLEKCLCRLYQFGMNRIAFPFIGLKPATYMEGEGSLQSVPGFLKDRHYYRPFLVLYSENAKKNPHIEKLLEGFKALSFDPVIYTAIVPNPTFASVMAAKAAYEKGNCDSIVVIGGGSAIDTCKALGAMVQNKLESPAPLKGLLKVRKRYPMLIAIPTTAGTGSETTLASVVVNETTHDKFSINDPKLVPTLAVLDSSLLESLPKPLIAGPGMDVLTHAVEAYIGHARTRQTASYSIIASRLVLENLPLFYADAHNQKAREKMMKASFLAGAAFTRSYVGYVHALAHALGGFYGLPHGQTNATLLPHVLRAYGKKAHKALARLADASKLTDPNLSLAEKAEAYIAHIEKMNATMGIPANFHGILKEEDIPALAKHAAKEGNPLYPVPKEMDENELAMILKEVL